MVLLRCFYFLDQLIFAFFVNVNSEDRDVESLFDEQNEALVTKYLFLPQLWLGPSQLIGTYLLKMTTDNSFGNYQKQ